MPAQPKHAVSIFGVPWPPTPGLSVSDSKPKFYICKHFITLRVMDEVRRGTVSFRIVAGWGPGSFHALHVVFLHARTWVLVGVLVLDSDRKPVTSSRCTRSSDVLPGFFSCEQCMPSTERSGKKTHERPLLEIWDCVLPDAFKSLRLNTRARTRNPYVATERRLHLKDLNKLSCNSCYGSLLDSQI